MSKQIDSLRRELDQCQTQDAHRLRQRLRTLEKGAAKPGETSPQSRSDKLQTLGRDIASSRAACARRAALIPESIHYPPELPVSQRAEEIVGLLAKHQVLVVAGDTGSGKTTQLPKICLQAGLGRRGQIGHTQPRRLAAVAVAARIAEELGLQSGKGIGHQVRFQDTSGPDAFLKVMTDGILLNEIAQDRFLNRYEVLIIDEAHERSLNIDFLLGFLKQLLPRRPDLKLIITSATIDVEKFSRHFEDAPIVSVSGRTYPVHTHYAPPNVDEGEGAAVEAQIDGIVDAVGDILAGQYREGGKGDILVFVSGEREIREAAQALRQRRFPNLEILPLYARLRRSEQARIFAAHKTRRVVLSTNVAETSLTVPGINYVVDTGLARISRYSPQSKVQRLPIEPISQASANQRKGRCGRLARGVCIRLYSESDFEARPEFTDPEIRRTNLASVILRMKHLRLGEAEAFPFIEAPEASAINEGRRLLQELNALEQSRKLTAAGRKMAVLPVDPKLGRMLVTADRENCLSELLIIVSGLSIQDPREWGANNRSEARASLAEFDHKDSDFLSLVKLWQTYEEQRQALGQGPLRKYCKRHYLSYMRMREWREIHHQLRLACQGLQLKENRSEASYAAVHRAIISGSLNQIALHQEGRNFLNNRNRKFSLFPTSTLASATCRWVVTGALIETSQTFATMAARIEPAWVEEMAAHLVKRDYFQPHFSAKRQEVRAYEKVQLYGLTLIEQSSVAYAPLNPEEARELFIREALVQRQVDTSCKFYRNNLKLLAALEREEDKIRRPDALVSEADVEAFYEERLPAGICSTRELERWVREDAQANARLTMDRDALLAGKVTESQAAAYPDQAAVRKNRLQIDYQFEPGAHRDGASVQVPLPLLAQMRQADLDWAVPGLLRERCIALIKGLPKSLRKHFIPVSGFVDEVLPAMHSGDGDLIDALLAQMRSRRNLQLSRADFEVIELPPHLQAKIKLVDEEGEELDFGTDLESLKQEHAQEASPAVAADAGSDFDHPIEVSGLQDWTIEALPASVSIGDGLVLERYPALVDAGEGVDVRLFADPARAEAEYRDGLIRLYMLRSVQQKNLLLKQFKRLAKDKALTLPRQLQDMPEAATRAVYHRAFEVEDKLPRDKAQFEARLTAGKARLHGCGVELEKMLKQLLDEQWSIRKRLADLDGAELDYLSEDVSGQLDELLADGFLTETHWEFLQQYPRYLRAINERLDKAPHMGPRDEPNTGHWRKYWRRYAERRDAPGVSNAEAMLRLRWMLEEYRVSLFAQKLGTSMPVSEKRLEKQFRALDD